MLDKLHKRADKLNIDSHTFVVCAYKESPYLKACIQSLLGQTVRSKIIMITSTPNQFILNMAKRYGIEYYVNQGEKDIVSDWNFAYQQAKTKFVTLAHQDDVYASNYAEELLMKLNFAKYPLIAFTNYNEIRNDKIQKNNTMLSIKRLMLTPLKFRILQRSRFIRRLILSFGCPICCPSVTYNKDKLPKEIFQVGFRSDEDWQAWEKLSKLKGEFIYCKKILTYHRIHEDSATTAIIGDNVRSKEDYDMFRKFWPDFIAKGLVKLYARSEQSNNLGKEA